MKNIRISIIFLLGALVVTSAACGEDECTSANCQQLVEAGADDALAADGGMDAISALDEGIPADSTLRADQASPPPDTLAAVDNSVDNDSGLPPAGLVDVDQARALIASGTITLLDVREPFEFDAGHIEGALNLAWTSGVLEAEWATLPTDKGILVYCRSGNRSAQAVAFLETKGFAPLWDLDGGVIAWENAGQPLVQ